MDCKTVTQRIRTGVRDYVRDNRLECLTIGVSGGADSASVCALVRPVCDELGIPLIGRSITIESNKADEISRAQMVGNAFCHDFKEVDFTELYFKMAAEFQKEEGTLDKIAKGNIKARTRMQYLYCIAGKNKGLVLSTDNLTEYYLGFFTLCGDVGDLGPVQQLWKTEIYQVMDYLAVYEFSNIPNAKESLIACRYANPTDGLGISNSDLDQIGTKDYPEAERILKTWLTKDSDNFHWDNWLKWPDGLERRPAEYDDFVTYRDMFKDHLVVQRYEKTHFKRKWPIVLQRTDLFERNTITN